MTVCKIYSVIFSGFYGCNAYNLILNFNLDSTFSFIRFCLSQINYFD